MVSDIKWVWFLEESHKSLLKVPQIQDPQWQMASTNWPFKYNIPNIVSRKDKNFSLAYSEPFPFPIWSVQFELNLWHCLARGIPDIYYAVGYALQFEVGSKRLTKDSRKTSPAATTRDINEHEKNSKNMLK